MLRTLTIVHVSTHVSTHVSRHVTAHVWPPQVCGPLKFDLPALLTLLFFLLWGFGGWACVIRMVLRLVFECWSSLTQIVKERDIEWQNYVKLLRQRRMTGMMKRWCILAVRRRASHRCSLHSYAHVCRRMLTYAHVCSRMLADAHVCSRMLTYAHVCSRMGRRGQAYLFWLLY
jgi:hypothetical protein